MEAALDQTPELIALAEAEEAELLRLAGVGRVDSLQRGRVALHLEAIDERSEERALVEEMNRLRAGEDVARMTRVQVVRRDPFADDRREVHQQQEDHGNDGWPVAAEAPPHELPLARHIIAFLLRRQLVSDVGVPRLLGDVVRRAARRIGCRASGCRPSGCRVCHGTLTFPMTRRSGCAGRARPAPGPRSACRPR